MKRFFFASLVAIMLVSLAGCGNNTPSNDISESPAMQEEQNNVPKSSESENSEPIKESSPQDTAEPQGTTDALDNAVEKDVADTIASLNSEYEKLVTGIDTFDKYVNNTEKVEGFYTKIYEETQALCIRLCEYSIKAIPHNSAKNYYRIAKTEKGKDFLIH